ncbi:MAG: nucleotide exchange factor GrpE [Candidatus Methanosuratincola sp.]
MGIEGSGGNVHVDGIAKGERSVDSEEEKSRDLERLQDEICRYKEQLDALQRELAESKNRLRYMQADCENIRKRSERQMEEARLTASMPLVCDLLEVVDELELALKSASESDTQGALVQGVKMTLKKMKKVLEKHGVSQIECLMKPLDPERHMVVSKEERDDLEENTVVEEIRRGYSFRGIVIRPSVVKVSVKPSGSTKQKEED